MRNEKSKSQTWLFKLELSLDLFSSNSYFALLQMDWKLLQQLLNTFFVFSSKVLLAFQCNLSAVLRVLLVQLQSC